MRYQNDCSIKFGSSNVDSDDDDDVDYDVDYDDFRAVNDIYGYRDDGNESNYQHKNYKCWQVIDDDGDDDDDNGVTIG